MTTANSSRVFDARHVQLARAAFAAIAAIMVTFSQDHSAGVGLAVFGGFALATGIVHVLAAWLVQPAGRRWPSIILAALTIAAGMVASVGDLRTSTGFFAIVITWAFTTGLVEAIDGFVARRGPRALKPGDVAPWSDGTPAASVSPLAARESIVVGIAGVALAVALLLVPAEYALPYTVEEANASYTLTGITIAVGLFGVYAAIVAVYLGIAGFSPRRTPVAAANRPESEDQS
ncbi:acyl-CoA synthetase [Microbacterium sp. NPDC055357]